MRPQFDFNGSAHIDVERFVQEHITPYGGDASFLASPTARTEKLRDLMNDL